MKSIYKDHIHYGDGTIYLKKPITFKFKRFISINKFKFEIYYKTSIPEFNLVTMEDNIVDVVFDLCETLHFMYEKFAIENDDMLTKNAQEIKYNLLKYIDKVINFEDDDNFNGDLYESNSGLRKIAERISGKEEIMFKIWSEGYLCTGMEGIPARAQYMGSIKATCFQEACNLKFKNDTYYNKTTLTYWGCSLYDNKIDAEKSFG